MRAGELERAFAQALAALGAGDVQALDALLRRHPELAHERAAGVLQPYDGYFHRATLLHHVSGNPAVTPVARTAPDLARCLLEHGAAIDAATEAGPAQPDDVGWTALGLVATSGAARAAGVQIELLDLLLECGADPDARDGIALVGAIYYGESAAAAHLARRGANVDLVTAAGLGDVAAIESFAAPDGSLREGAHALVHYGLVPWPDSATDADVFAVALCFAARSGRVDALRRLVELGADPNARPPLDHRATALHWCVIGDQPAALKALLELGADREVRDATYSSTPLGWCQALGRPHLAPLLA